MNEKYLVQWLGKTLSSNEQFMEELDKTLTAVRLEERNRLKWEFVDPSNKGVNCKAYYVCKKCEYISIFK